MDCRLFHKDLRQVGRNGAEGWRAAVACSEGNSNRVAAGPADRHAPETLTNGLVLESCHASVLHVAGNTVSMPDTTENRAAFPQHLAQKEGLGFPNLIACSPNLARRPRPNCCAACWSPRPARLRSLPHADPTCRRRNPTHAPLEFRCVLRHCLRGLSGLPQVIVRARLPDDGIPGAPRPTRI